MIVDVVAAFLAEIAVYGGLSSLLFLFFVCAQEYLAAENVISMIRAAK
ncbi:MAG: hypothetical protein GX957_11510 [Clostridiaceae bacterium]|nr:hypothetical protein [Clostridiaceae bacterium]